MKLIPRNNTLLAAEVPRATSICCSTPLACSAYYQPLNKERSYPTPTSTYKRVRFCEDDNQYHEAATSCILGSTEEKRNVWYGSKDHDRFLHDFTNATINMEKGHRHRARVWLQTLHQTYQASTKAHATPNKNDSDKNMDQERLRFLYSQEPNLVGMEDILLPKLRADGQRRQRALLNAIYHIRQSPRMDLSAQEYHIRVLSQRMSQPSKIFSIEIALAQFGADPWNTTSIGAA